MLEISEYITKNLQEMYNVAVTLLKDKKYDEAVEIYDRIICICDMVKYVEGKTMAYMSLANLYYMKNDYKNAFENANNALGYESENESIKEFLKELSKEAVKYGMAKEENGEYDVAINMFTSALPYIGNKRREIIEREINILKGKNNE